MKTGQHEDDHDDHEVGEDSPGDQAADEGCDQESDWWRRGRQGQRSSPLCTWCRNWKKQITGPNFHISCHFRSPGHNLIAVDDELGHCLKPFVLSFIPTGSEDVALINMMSYTINLITSGSEIMRTRGWWPDQWRRPGLWWRCWVSGQSGTSLSRCQL